MARTFQFLLFPASFAIVSAKTLPARAANPSDTADGKGSFVVIGDWGNPFTIGDEDPDSMQHCWGPHWKCMNYCGVPAGGDCCKPGTDDWKVDEYSQVRVADKMADWAKAHNAQFVINVGDNFYPNGVSGTDDPLWQKVFEDRYSHDSLQIPWLSVNGNHDWGGYECFVENGVLPRGMYQVQYDTEHDWAWPRKKDTRWVMPDLWHKQRINFGDVTLDIIFVDTNFWDAHDGPGSCGQSRTDIGKSHCTGPGEQSACKAFLAAKTEAQKQWFNEQVENSDGIWKLVVGHHPYDGFVSGFGTPAEVTSLLIQNNFSMYMCGHAHAMDARWQSETGQNQHSDPGSDSIFELQQGAGGGAFPDGVFNPKSVKKPGELRWGYTAVTVNGHKSLNIWYGSSESEDLWGPIEVKHPCMQFHGGGNCPWMADKWNECQDDGTQTRKVDCPFDSDNDCANSAKPRTTQKCTPHAGPATGLIVAGISGAVIVLGVIAVFVIRRVRRPVQAQALLRESSMAGL